MLVRCREAAQLLGVSEWQVRKLAHDRQLAFIQLTVRSPLLFDRADLQAWIETHKQKVEVQR